VIHRLHGNPLSRGPRQEGEHAGSSPPPAQASESTHAQAQASESTHAQAQASESTHAQASEGAHTPAQHGPADEQAFIPENRAMDAELRRLNESARTGGTSARDAERQMNRYVLAGCVLAANPAFPRPDWLVLTPEDAPQPANVPDLGHAIRHVFCKKAHGDCAQMLIEYVIPCFRQHGAFARYAGDLAPCLNVVTAFLLGLYDDALRKPSFHVKKHFFGRMHALLTASDDDRQRFCRAYPHVLLAAMAEYLTRLLPEYFPVEHEHLMEQPMMHYFFERVPLFSDEIRSQNETRVGTWAQLDAACAAFMEKIGRLKRYRGAKPAALPRRAKVEEDDDRLWRYWALPLLVGNSTPETALLAQSHGLQAARLGAIQTVMQLYALPSSLRHIQEEALSAIQDSRKAHFATKVYVCSTCVDILQPRNHLRLDATTGGVICSACKRQSIILVETLGRIIVTREGAKLMWCPYCRSVQRYSESVPWWTGRCQHAALQLQDRRGGADVHADDEPRRGGTKVEHEHGRGGTKIEHEHGRGGANDEHRHVCHRGQCNNAQARKSVHRINHLTGELYQFWYCSKHQPSERDVRHQCNVRDMVAWNGCKDFSRRLGRARDRPN
jgi:hypothetical protein